MARYAARICQIGCDAECPHGHACVVFRVDRDHPHPTDRGHEVHYAMDDDGMMHEWRGARGRCRIYDPAVEDDGYSEDRAPLTITVTSGGGPGG